MFILPFFRKKDFKLKPLVLIILDGFGLAPPSEGNAITLAKTPNYQSFIKTFPNTRLIASGESVGLPANEVGNTEVGHLTLGAGRVVLQDLKRIDLAIEKGNFYENEAFLKASAHVRKYGSRLHILGLVGSGRVHSSINHLFALLQFCRKEQLKDVYLHIFTDGRDSPPKEGLEIVERIERKLEEMKVGKIASISGRYYAMDRDRRWERTEKAYRAIVQGLAIQTFSSYEAVKSAYARGQTDEFIQPTVIADVNGPIGVVNDNDAVIFFNYRIDRPRQLTMAFVLPNFENLKFFDFGYNPELGREEGQVAIGQTFKRERIPKNLFFVTMTEYHKNLPVSAIAFPPQVIEKCLSQVISEAGLKQLHMAESEKERFVTYYFNGMREKPFPNEDWVIIPSPKVSTYDKKPEMSLNILVNELLRQVEREIYSFIVVNFANPDMVAHTGNIRATITAIEVVDRCLAKVVKEVIPRGGIALITADHGNAEEMLTFPTSSYFYTSAKGNLNTDHSNNPVPLILLSKDWEDKKINLGSGGLADVAPTVLSIMGIDKPLEMTGKSLLQS